MDPYDVNRDGIANPVDPLTIINLLNSTSSGPLTLDNTAYAVAEYVDINGDNAVTPLDALWIINALNSRR